MVEEKINNAQFNVGIYIRLSQEDDDKKYESDSESVINQRTLLKNYVKENNFNFIDEYVDDGFTGTDFDRPGFKRLIEDVKNKRINCIIVKDLSRFGRDHVMTGYYTETYFPENRIRFISVLESIDTFKTQASNDSATFIQAFNDFYSKQNSIKIKRALDDKRKEGKYIGSLPPFGYKRDENDKGHLVPDEKVAHIVREIFKMRANGTGVSEITTILNEKNYPTPSRYKGTKYSSRLLDNKEWNISSVKKVLSNRMYCGDMVQKKQAKVSYKSKKKITLPESMNFIVENTHEALVDKATFEYIQELTHSRIKHAKIKTGREKRLFEGLLFCKECTNRLSINYRSNLDYWTINCNIYSRDPSRGRCYPHFFPYEYLEQQLLTEFNNILNKYINNLDIDELNNEVVKRVKNESVDYRKRIEDLNKDKAKLLNKLTSMYDDKLSGGITPFAYKEMSKKTENEIEVINKTIKETELKLEEINSKADIIPDFHKQIKKLLNLKKPKKELLYTLIHRIEIDKDRNITFKFKFNIIDDYTFTYQNLNKARNPYGKKGKPKG